MARDAQKAPVMLPKSPEAVELLNKVEVLLREEQTQKALDLIRRSRVSSDWVTNAVGVCLLRLGQVQPAVDVLRGLVLAVGVHLKPDAPAVFKTNFATALLLADNVSGCLSALADVNDEQNPTVQRLRAAVRGWKEGLTFWQKVQWYMGGHPARKVELAFTPGDL